MWKRTGGYIWFRFIYLSPHARLSVTQIVVYIISLYISFAITRTLRNGTKRFTCSTNESTWVRMFNHIYFKNLYFDTHSTNSDTWATIGIFKNRRCDTQSFVRCTCSMVDYVPFLLHICNHWLDICFFFLCTCSNVVHMSSRSDHEKKI